MTLETLYKKSKTGAIVYCTISTDNEVITVETGQVGTENPVFHTTTCSPKNVGKSNETTGAQQAVTEAVAKQLKKIKTGYVFEESGETSIRLPMKVKVYQDQIKNVEFPCYDSPKLNGVNFTVHFDGEELSASSRGGEPFIVPPQQVKPLIKIMKKLWLRELNGEQYIHDKHLQDIQAAVTKHNDMTQDLVFFIFNIPGVEGTYEDELKTMDLISAELTHNYVQLVPVRKNVQTHAEIATHFREDISAGYEGTVIRNAKAVYTHNVRSSDVFKYKEAQDAEFQVTGHKLDKHGHVVFTCASSGGSFSVKPKGTNEQRLAMAAIATSYYGKWLKVEFEVLSKAGKPTKPVGICFRNCDEDGQPLE